MTKLVAAPMDRIAFEPYGAFVDHPSTIGDRRLFSQWLGSDAAAAAPVLHTNAVAASAFPVTIDKVERHPSAAQIFIPLDVSRYLVTVMPSRPDGTPDHAEACSFLVPGTVGTIYRRGVWHVGMTALDREAHFAVLMWRGTAEDDVFMTIPRLTVTSGADAAMAAPSSPMEIVQ